MGRGEAAVLLGTLQGAAGSPVSMGPSFAPIERRLFQPVEEHAFAHPAEEDLARIFSFYRVQWVYEPTTFHLKYREDGRPAEQITPDFYLPDHDLFIELTTMRQRLVTRKNRKIRRFREIFPSVQIKLLYRKDYDRLVGAYPSPDHVTDPRLGQTVIEASDIQRRLSELATEIVASTCDLAIQRNPEICEQPPALHLIGVGSGTQHVLADLAARLDLHECHVTTDRLMLSRYGNGHDDDQVCIGQAIKFPVAGRDVVLVADIVSSGLSLVYVVNWLHSEGARSVRICTLLDRTEARIIDIPLDFVGFRAPDEVLVGYGLSSCPQFCDLPYIASLLEADELESSAVCQSARPISSQAN